MKAELKLFIRTVITEQLEKWNEESGLSPAKPRVSVKKKKKKSPKKKKIIQEDNPYGPPTTIAVSESESEESVEQDIEEKVEATEILEILDTQKTKERYRTLIRIGIEFCVTIQDCYFLFYDLFLLF